VGEAVYFGPVCCHYCRRPQRSLLFWLTITAILPFFGGNVNRIGEILLGKSGEKVGRFWHDRKYRGDLL